METQILHEDKSNRKYKNYCIHDLGCVPQLRFAQNRKTIKEANKLDRQKQTRFFSDIA